MLSHLLRGIDDVEIFKQDPMDRYTAALFVFMVQETGQVVFSGKKTHGGIPGLQYPRTLNGGATGRLLFR